jgi:hypothetical protein
MKDEIYESIPEWADSWNEGDDWSEGSW